MCSLVKKVKGAEKRGELLPCLAPYGDHYWPQGSLFGAQVSKVTACAAESVGDAWGRAAQEVAGLVRSPSKAEAETQAWMGGVFHSMFPGCELGLMELG